MNRKAVIARQDLSLESIPIDNSDWHTLYILKCGHLLICYNSTAARSVIRHRNKCLRKGKFVFREDIRIRVPKVSTETIQEALLRNLSEEELQKMQTNIIEFT